ncbi:ferritin-like domain-containing protein [Halomicroarcula limicola]|uniref:Ferritin-like domain-containing protein n=1 Tax=Haloarcula limicola TaxID=1429915 RepID=A0A8J7YE74_9EURY|nr:ferritin-like domain-containing protein [Halomicroarcula limicola]MBV0924878.1 ferritin-like domain-containing protein [Halomicroarcula limicola]
MAPSDLHDLFMHNLEDIYYAENELLDALDELESQTENEEIASAFSEHREETQGHIDRLEEAFDVLGKEPEREECEGIEGLIEEHEEFADEDPTQDVLDVHNLIAAQKTEHYEIAAYGTLAMLADRLGEDEVGDLLHENLEEEKDALDELSSLAEEFDYGQIAAD